jgi:hypothetical protein
MTSSLKHLSLSDENTGSALYLDQDSEEEFVDEEPSVWNTFFLIQKRAVQKSIQKMIYGD